MIIYQENVMNIGVIIAYIIEQFAAEKCEPMTTA